MLLKLDIETIEFPDVHFEVLVFIGNTRLIGEDKTGYEILPVYYKR